jgi:hypothetical protein
MVCLPQEKRLRLRSVKGSIGKLLQPSNFSHLLDVAVLKSRSRFREFVLAAR